MPAARHGHPALPGAMAALERLRTPRDLANLARFGITAANPLGVSMAGIQQVARGIGRDHALAEALWQTDVYEARLLAAYVDEPALVTATQMNRWCRDFDNWGVCDTLCFALFDKTAGAWGRVDAWAPRRAEFVRRAAFALLASLAVHDKAEADAPFLARLPLVEAASTDTRPLVRKGASWALRTTGRRNRALHAAALALARRLAEADDAGARWVGRDAVRDLTSVVARRAVDRGSARAR